MKLEDKVIVTVTLTDTGRTFQAYWPRVMSNYTEVANGAEICIRCKDWLMLESIGQVKEVDIPSAHTH